ncbi:MAG: response regulator [Bacteriovoracaceae bacterium]|nr:response regulator [Bacteriovoracaceae bacterium]
METNEQGKPKKSKQQKHNIIRVAKNVESKFQQKIINALAESAMPHLKQKNILIVDDDVAFNVLATHLLKDLGDVNVQSASTPSIAVKKMFDMRPDLIILDIMLDRVNGIQLAKAINCLYEDGIPIVFVSANHRYRNDIILSNFDLRKVTFLPKPIDRKSLQMMVTKLL